ncbi:hypothetical protein N7468_008805 [Penicillium chermesinum]|uniref:Uncharacterized protein n=1 Tax=Penicillium chermesinum TaxID=63820 RepID=A0A9W9NGN1_9EURO|nr:uncharacterized protein N7468_008805 [Penicillium chermesinum]KAJ5219601.1 hypothetical protein N7468_008805 [Penicillium chermesinum]
MKHDISPKIGLHDIWCLWLSTSFPTLDAVHSRRRCAVVNDIYMLRAARIRTYAFGRLQHIPEHTQASLLHLKFSSYLTFVAHN